MPIYQIRPDRDHSNGWRILTIAGIPFYIEPSFLFFVGIIIYYEVQNGASISQAGLLGFIIFFSLLIHEAGHALAARLLGYRDIAVSLVMFGGYTSHPSAGRGHSLLIVLAGPLATFGIIFLADKLLNHGPQFVQDSSGAGYFLLARAYTLNLFWLIFNLLPVYPLDGGQAVFCLLSYLARRERAMLIASVISIITCTLVGAWAYNNQLYILLIFMVLSGMQNYQILNALRK